MTPLSSRPGGDEAGRRRHAGELHPSAPPSSIELCTPPPSFPHCLALVPIGACVQQTSVCGRREPQIHGTSVCVGLYLQRVGPQACALFSFYLCGLKLAFAPQCFAFVHVSLAFGRKTSPSSRSVLAFVARSSPSRAAMAEEGAALLELDCGDFEVSVESWETLAQAQKDQGVSTPETFSTVIEHKQALAFLDRNDFEDPWRRVFVVHDQEESQIHLFFENGECVNENDTPYGRQKLDTDDTGFLAQWDQTYYSAYAADDLPTPADHPSPGRDPHLGGAEEHAVEGASTILVGVSRASPDHVARV